MNLPDRLGDSDTDAILRSGRAYGVAAAIAVGVVAYMSGGVSGVEMGGAVAATAPTTRTDVLMYTDWSTAIGTTDAARRDTDRTVPWDNTKGTATLFEVVDTASQLGFPSAIANVAIAKNGGGVLSSAVGVRMDTSSVAPTLPVIAIGDSRYFRMYFRNTTPDSYTTDLSVHPVQDGGPGTVGGSWEIVIQTNTDNTWEVELASLTNAVVGCGTCDNFDLATARNTPIQLSKDSVYVLEWQNTRTHTDSVQFHAWVGVVQGESIDWRWDSTDFYSRSTNWPGALAGQTLTLGDDLNLTMGTELGLTGQQLGSNGWEDGGAAHDAYIYGAWAICADSRCGAYPISGVEN